MKEKKVKGLNENKLKKELEKYKKRVKKEDIKDVIEGEKEVIRRIIEKFPLLKRELAKIRLLYELLKDYWNGEYKEIPWATIVSIVSALLYIINPYDLIPDIIPLLGQLDDIAILGLVWAAISSDLKDYARWKAKRTPELKEVIIEAFGEESVVTG